MMKDGPKRKAKSANNAQRIQEALDKKSEAKYQVWLRLREKKNKRREEEFCIEFNSETIFKWGTGFASLLMMYSIFALYFNVSRELIEGDSRGCSKLCSPYINFDFKDVICSAYSFPNSFWLLPP